MVATPPMLSRLSRNNGNTDVYFSSTSAVLKDKIDSNTLHKITYNILKSILLKDMFDLPLLLTQFIHDLWLLVETDLSI